MFKPTVVIIGAGPFGLSIAAYLQSFGVNFRIFGTPMHRWRAQMPKGMFLKSEAFASNLADPSGQYTLQEYCAEKALPYGIAPVPIETFSRYALSYQQRRIPMVEDTFVTALDRGTDAFKLLLATGEEIRTRKVVIATGLSHAAYIPNGLKKLPLELLSHSSDHHDLSQFKGRDVIVIGAGQSALETAALLNECQAKVRLLVRRPSIEWNPLPTLGLRSLWQQLRRPQSALGSGFRTRFCATHRNYSTDYLRVYEQIGCINCLVRPAHGGCAIVLWDVCRSRLATRCVGPRCTAVSWCSTSRIQMKSYTNLSPTTLSLRLVIASMLDHCHFSVRGSCIVCALSSGRLGCHRALSRQYRAYTSLDWPARINLDP